MRGAAQDIATSVEARLDREASDREQRDDSLSGRVDGVLDRIDQLAEAAREQSTERARLDDIDRSVSHTQETVEALGARLDGVAHVTADLPSMEDRLTAQLRDATADLPAIEDRLAGQLRDADRRTARHGRPAVDAAPRKQPPNCLSIEDRLAGQLTSATAELPAMEDRLSTQLREVTAELPTIEDRLAGQLPDATAELPSAMGRPAVDAAPRSNRVGRCSRALEPRR